MATLLTLPGEIVIHIFTLLVIDLGDAPPEPIVLHLSAICKSLRELVVNAPTLWSRIRLRRFPHDMNGAYLFIARSKDCLLDMSVYFDFVDHLAPAIVRSYAVSRWRKLTVRGFSSDIVAFLQAIMDTPTPNLTEVHLLPPRGQSSCAGNHVPLLAGASSALRTLTMRGCIGCLAPLPHLTTLNISCLLCSYGEFRGLVQGLPNLRTLILGELLDHLEADTVAEPISGITGLRPLIEAPSVKSLAVGFTNTHLTLVHERPLLAFLSVPNLEYLEVCGSRADYGELSGKPLPELRTLCLRDMNFSAFDAALYRSFVHITSLELDNVQDVELLAAPDENGALPWPQLKTLRCRFVDDENCSWLAKLLHGRSHLALQIPLERKEDVLAISGNHDVRFLSDELFGLIRAEDFERAAWEEDENGDYSDSDFSDPTDLFGDYDHYDDYGFEYDLEDQVDDYVEDDDDDDGLEGVAGWF
ncbi:hypothetical protein DFH06DRAFT_682829 [Mycena polygramma]|nr:hypothetical protein DFH06DRAFT_682829 [Mycena polygramma]